MMWSWLRKRNHGCKSWGPIEAFSFNHFYPIVTSLILHVWPDIGPPHADYQCYFGKSHTLPSYRLQKSFNIKTKKLHLYFAQISQTFPKIQNQNNFTDNKIRGAFKLIQQIRTRHYILGQEPKEKFEYVDKFALTLRCRAQTSTPTAQSNSVAYRAFP